MPPSRLKAAQGARRWTRAPCLTCAPTPSQPAPPTLHPRRDRQAFPSRLKVAQGPGCWARAQFCRKEKKPRLGPFLFSKLFEHGPNTWGPRDATHQPARWRSEPISRVLSLDDHLSSAYVAAGLTLEQPERGPGRPMAFLFALSPDGVCQAAPLPTRWCALTAQFQLFSLGASPQRESSFLWHCPSGRPARPLAGILPCGARTFLTEMPWHLQRGRLAHSAKRAVYTNGRDKAPPVGVLGCDSTCAPVGLRTLVHVHARNVVLLGVLRDLRHVLLVLRQALVPSGIGLVAAVVGQAQRLGEV